MCDWFGRVGLKSRCASTLGSDSDATFKSMHPLSVMIIGQTCAAAFAGAHKNNVSEGSEAVFFVFLCEMGLPDIRHGFLAGLIHIVV